MSKYAITVMSKKTNGWTLTDTAGVNMTAVANIKQLKRDVEEFTSEYFIDDNDLSRINVEKTAKDLVAEIEDIDAGEILETAVGAIVTATLGRDIIDVDNMDISEFVNVGINVDYADLLEEMNANRIENELSYACILNSVGVIAYEVTDPDSVVVGKVVLNWLEG